MTYIEPALAHKFEEKRLAKSSWMVEEKFDGHRLLFNSVTGEAWSRNMKPVELPPHLKAAIKALPPMIGDSERVRRGAGTKSYDVSRVDRPEEFELVVFDVLFDNGSDLTVGGLDERWTHRRARLERLLPAEGVVRRSVVLFERADVKHIAEAMVAVCSREGEGVMVKDMLSSYRPGKRMQAWMKLKRLAHAEGVLVRFEPGLLGPHSVAVVRDDDGNFVMMKGKDDEWRRRMDAEGDKHLGRRVLFDYTERTQYNSYREPRWDRFKDE